MRARRSQAPSYFHKPTGTIFHVIGARQVEAGSGKAFVCQNGDSRERLFLVESGFDMPLAERNALWTSLFETEVKRNRAAAAKEKALEKRRLARERDESEFSEDGVEQIEREAFWSDANRTAYASEPNHDPDVCESSDPEFHELIESDEGQIAAADAD